MFKPRLTKPEAGNKYYIRKADGGYSDAILGKPTDPDCNVLSNCVGMSFGRFNEVGEWGYCKYLAPVNAGDFMDFKGDCETGFDPRLGACMVWKKSGSAGHVASVEKVIDNDTVVTSESSYNGQAFYTKTRHRKDGNWEQDGYTFKGFIYNPAVKSWPEEYNDLNDALHEQIAALESEKANLLGEIGSLGKTILTQSDAHQAEMEKVQKELNKAKESLTAAKEEIANLKHGSQIDELKQSYEADLAEWPEKVKSLTEQLQAEQKKFRESEANADKQISQLQTDLVTKEAEYQHELSEMQARNNSLMEMVKERDKTIKTLKEQRGDVNGDGKVNITDLFALITIIFRRKKEK